MPITPETKNWTWVLERRCPECGFDAPAVDRQTGGRLTRDNAALWPEILKSPFAAIRPTDERWSGLEYACHVRDTLRIFDGRLQRMLQEDDPEFANWDQDQTAVEDRYQVQDPSDVTIELASAAAVIADRFDSVTNSQWDRPGTRSDGSRFTIDTFARYFLHDPVHHVDDVRKGFAQLGA